MSRGRRPASGGRPQRGDGRRGAPPGRGKGRAAPPPRRKDDRAAPPPRRDADGAPAHPRRDDRPGQRRQVIYGRNAVREALRGRRRVHRVWATQATAAEDWDAKLTIVGAEELEERTGSAEHQGVAALVDPYPYADEAELLAVSDPLLVALDEVTDPQNLGAVARTAEAVGATGIVIPERRAVDVTPAVCKASAGAVEHLAVARVRNLADFLAEAKRHDCWVYGAAAEARTPYRQPDYSGGVVLVLGAEGKGLRPRVASMCDDLVALPLKGRVASLNVSATAAVLLYEMLQQRLDAST
jgi:23S rRNA (guanosine2251-2'-O)-methyltransferase